MHLNEVIKHPILSEKTYQQMASGVYTFAVDFRTNKAEVKKVVEHIFDVKVEKVNIQTVQKKPKKIGRFEGFTNRYKKAIVTLVEGHVINIFPEEVVAEEPKATKEKEPKEISEAEKKAAEKIAAKAAIKKDAPAKKAKPADKVEAKHETKKVDHVKKDAPADKTAHATKKETEVKK